MLSNTENILTCEYIGSEYMELTEIEKKVIMELAKKGALSGYDFHLGGHRQRGVREALLSSSYWEKIKKELGHEGKQLITPIELKRHYSEDGRGRRRDLYWLSHDGIVLSILEGASTSMLLKYTKEYYPEREDIHVVIELSQIAGKEELATAFLLSRMKNEKIDLSKILISVGHTFDRKKAYAKARAMKSVLKKYPKYHQFLMDKWKGTFKAFQTMDEVLRSE